MNYRPILALGLTFFFALTASVAHSAKAYEWLPADGGQITVIERLHGTQVTLVATYETWKQIGVRSEPGNVILTIPKTVTASGLDRIENPFEIKKYGPRTIVIRGKNAASVAEFFSREIANPSENHLEGRRNMTYRAADWIYDDRDEFGDFQKQPYLVPEEIPYQALTAAINLHKEILLGRWLADDEPLTLGLSETFRRDLTDLIQTMRDDRIQLHKRLRQNEELTNYQIWLEKSRGDLTPAIHCFIRLAAFRDRMKNQRHLMSDFDYAKRDREDHFKAWGLALVLGSDDQLYIYDERGNSYVIPFTGIPSAYGYFRAKTVLRNTTLDMAVYLESHFELENTTIRHVIVNKPLVQNFETYPFVYAEVPNKRKAFHALLDAIIDRLNRRYATIEKPIQEDVFKTCEAVGHPEINTLIESTRKTDRGLSSDY